MEPGHVIGVINHVASFHLLLVLGLYLYTVSSCRIFRILKQTKKCTCNCAHPFSCFGLRQLLSHDIFLFKSQLYVPFSSHEDSYS
ncbi:hypothetical protein K402DRAFT_16816 [Aulographum hederae CBS 113979]|uniref:Uncharacterized protein n=1 Tax=Aulographum hederae CBS 113979 TaxID=1176131 RepID=A0A6G1H821_9PEZI|nr:hypothetical protein K402DRAFT_16816 [Aulographum hederae CBS 113979]